ncbi:hypothetical protein RFF05_00560 [Bengtsoniella intestinalis]|uniref:hypothetical protein n=1 Tax=Bengtsoniella intestinalis TaxID=3073143 RepID=UPI00391FAE0E
MSEIKQRTAAWLYPTTIATMDSKLQSANCKSRSEYMENALKFYTGFLESQDATPFLAQAILDAISGALHLSEHRVANNLFRLSVETNMMMHLLSTTLDITPDELHSLRGRCIREVKQTRGNITVDHAIAFQQGTDLD